MLHITATESVLGINMTEGIYDADKEAAGLSRVHRLHTYYSNCHHKIFAYFVLVLLTRISTFPDQMACSEEDGHVSLFGDATCDVDDRTCGYILVLDMRTASESTRQTPDVKDRERSQKYVFSYRETLSIEQQHLQIIICIFW